MKEYEIGSSDGKEKKTRGGVVSERRYDLSFRKLRDETTNGNKARSIWLKRAKLIHEAKGLRLIVLNS